MKHGRPTWESKCPAGMLNRAKEAIDSGEAAARAYDRLNLKRFVSKSTFRSWALRRRKDQAARQEDQPAASDASSSPASSPSSRSEPLPLSVRKAAIEQMQQRLDCGEVPPYMLPQYVKSMVELANLDLRESAEERALEIHETKMVELRAKAKQEVEAKTVGGTKPMTREDVYDLVDKIMRGAA